MSASIFSVLGLLADQLEEVGGAHLVLAARLALRVHRGAQEGHVADAGDLDRVLERQEQARRRALFGLHLEQVLAVSVGRAAGHLVAVAARQHIGQRRLARAVRPHDRMHLARLDGQVDALEDGLVLFLELDVQVLDLKHRFSPFLNPVTAVPEATPSACC
jgi:hypothetical protein